VSFHTLSFFFFQFISFWPKLSHEKQLFFYTFQVLKFLVFNLFFFLFSVEFKFPKIKQKKCDTLMRNKYYF